MRVADVAGPVFLRSLVAGSFQGSRQRACATCASPLPPRARARAPGCPRCATLPGPQGLPGLPRPPTVPRRSGSQSPWHLPPPRGPAPIPSLLGRNPDPTSRTRRQGSQRFLVRSSQNSRGCRAKTLGSSARPSKISVVPPPNPQRPVTPDPGLVLTGVGDIRTLGNPAVLPLLEPREPGVP